MDIRVETLKRCYSIAGYADMPLAEKNRIYDAVRKQIEQEGVRHGTN